jgi:hypothetical protein
MTIPPINWDIAHRFVDPLVHPRCVGLTLITPVFILLAAVTVTLPPCTHLGAAV